LWLYWPSFNSATGVEEGQMRAIVNTYLSIVSSCIMTYVVSSIFGKGKLNMVNSEFKLANLFKLRQFNIEF